MTADPATLSELVEEVARRLLDDVAHREWDAARLVVRATVIRSESELFVRENDREIRVEDRAGADLALVRLRGALATPSTGAWMSAEALLDRGGTLSIEYDYDSEPNWTLPTSDEAYLIDLEEYPRSAEHLPSWHPAVRSPRR